MFNPPGLSKLFNKFWRLPLDCTVLSIFNLELEVVIEFKYSLGNSCFSNV